MRYLTKSRFSTGISCPTKLNYLDDPSYSNSSSTNEFLLALADGGHQIGALAKCLFPHGVEIDAIGHDAQVEQTSTLLSKGDVVLFEAAFRFEGLFVRADLIRKTGNTIELYEVKSKSYDPERGETQIFTRNGISSDFKYYIYDVAFQRHVVRCALPSFDIRSHLVLPDKSKPCSENGLAQRLSITRHGRSVQAHIDPSLMDGAIARELLFILPVDEAIDRLTGTNLEAGGYSWPFGEAIASLETIVSGSRFEPRANKNCKSCEFRSTSDDDLKDGRIECWTEQFDIDPNTLARGTIFDLTGFRSASSLIRDRRISLLNIQKDDLKYQEDDTKFTLSHRQWLQCEEAREAVLSPRVFKEQLSQKLASLSYPLHFIDFETATPPLPYHTGLRPYELLFFQFSHHRMDEKGNFRHASQYLDTRPGHFPSFDLIRELAKNLENDSGTILHWWTHERTVLLKVKEQLERSLDPPTDKTALIEFIDNVLHRLVDLGQDVVQPFVFLPLTKGSSSIKKVLPALLNHCPGLQDLYIDPTYGAPSGPASLNFNGQAWAVEQNGLFMDPYKLLSGRFNDPELDLIDDFDDGDAVVSNGGAAMIAYSLLQNINLNAQSRARIEEQLYRYCELDTLAMVMTYQGIQELIRNDSR